METPGEHDQDRHQDCDEGSGIKIESPRDIKWIKKVDRVFDGLVLNGYIRNTCFMSLDFLTGTRFYRIKRSV